MTLTQQQLEQIAGGIGRGFEETDETHDAVVKNAQRAVTNGAAIFDWDAATLVSLVAYRLDRLLPERVAAFANAQDHEILNHILHHGGPLSAIVHALAIEDTVLMDAVLLRVRALVDTLERAGVVIGVAPHFYLDSSKLQPRTLPSPGVPVARGSSAGTAFTGTLWGGGELIGPGACNPPANGTALPADLTTLVDELFPPTFVEQQKALTALRLDAVAERMTRIAEMTKQLMDVGVPPSLAFPEVVRQVDAALGLQEPAGPALVRQAGSERVKPSMAEQILMPPNIQFPTMQGGPLHGGPQVSGIAGAFGATVMSPQNGIGPRAGVQAYPRPAANVQVNGQDFDGYNDDPFDPNSPH